MDKRARPVLIEVLIAVGIFLMLFQFKFVSLDLTNPITIIVLLIVVAEFIRILYKFHQLTKMGVDLGNESLKSPVMYGINPQLGNLDYKVNKAMQPVYWVIAMIFVGVGLVGIIAAVIVSLSH